MKLNKQLKMVHMSLDLSLKEVIFKFLILILKLDGIKLLNNQKNLDQRKCSLFSLWFIVKQCRSHRKEKKINHFTNVLVIELKTEETHISSQPNLKHGLIPVNGFQLVLVYFQMLKVLVMKLLFLKKKRSEHNIIPIFCFKIII